MHGLNCVNRSTAKRERRKDIALSRMREEVKYYCEYRRLPNVL